jgi:hypothetical protein
MWAVSHLVPAHPLFALLAANRKPPRPVNYKRNASYNAPCCSLSPIRPGAPRRPRERDAEVREVQALRQLEPDS